MSARRLITVPFILAGAFLVMLFGSLTMWALLAVWPAVALILSIGSEVYLMRCLIWTPSKTVELRAWLMTFLVWCGYHLYAVQIYWDAKTTGGWVHVASWFTALAVTASLGSLAMLVRCAKGRPENA